MRRLLMGGSPVQGQYPASEVNDGTCPEKPVRLSRLWRARGIVYARQTPRAIESQWHWPRDTQLGEDVHHYSQRNGVQVIALLRTLAFNLLRWNGFRSIRAGLMAVAHDISRMLGWVGISLAGTG